MLKIENKSAGREPYLTAFIKNVLVAFLVFEGLEWATGYEPRFDFGLNEFLFVLYGGLTETARVRETKGKD